MKKAEIIMKKAEFMTRTWNTLKNVICYIPNKEVFAECVAVFGERY